MAYCKKILPFLLMLVLILGSVVVSCATSPQYRYSGKNTGNYLTMNTDRTLSGDIYTYQIFSHIDKVIVFNRSNRAEKIELSKEDWAYDSSIGLLTLKRDVKYKDIIIHIAGSAEKPVRFYLPGFRGEPEDLFVVLGKRLAINGFDYTFNPGTRTLIFRDDLDPEKESYSISYETESGGVGLGNWDPEDGDELAYLEAQHRREKLNRFYKSREEFYFFEAPAAPGDKPELVLRTPTPEEISAMMNYPVKVMKFRFRVSDKLISKEAGFDVSTPEEITLGGGGTYESWGKTLEEYYFEGRLKIGVSQMYHLRDAGTEAPLASIMVEFSPEEFYLREPSGEEYLISSEVLDLGVPINKRRYWAMRTYDLQERPEITIESVYTWSDGRVFMRISADNSNESAVEEMISEIIKYRSKSKRI